MAPKLGNATVTFDIILGDFGRVASVDYVRYLSEGEQSRLSGGADTEFFDEQRRIMFNLCCQIQWLKKDSIAHQVKEQGYIDRDILVGIGPDQVSQEVVARGTETVLSNIGFAVERRFTRVRVYTPCNGLTDLTREIAARAVSAYASDEEGDQIRSKGQCVLEDTTRIEFCSVPEKVIRRLGREGESRSVLILGTVGVNEIYKSHCVGAGISIFPLNRRDYELIDDAIVASIGKSPEELLLIKRALENEMISRFRKSSELGTIVEACTDFDFGLGKSSLEIFAEEMVTDVYGS